MSFIVAIFPHVFSSLQPETKKVYRQKYKNIKKYGSASVISGVRISEGRQLAKDVINSKTKIKAYGYKSLLAIKLGPVIQTLSISVHIFSFGSKFRNFAIAIAEIGAVNIGSGSPKRTSST